MQTPKRQFAANTRVRLRDGVDPEFYEGYSRVGNEGWIRKRKRERYGYPQVYIEWDKDHWAYNGQPDCWTFEGHFEAIEETPVAKQENRNEQMRSAFRDLAEQFVEGLMSVAEGGQPPEKIEAKADAEVELEPGTEDEDGPEPTWEEIADAASSKVRHAPAYLVIAFEEKDIPGAPGTLMMPHIYHKARTKDLAFLCQSQMTHFLAELQDYTIAQLLNATAAPDEEE